ncbi:MAG: iron uptake transporter permease EfeU [Streptosporangiales bacterium]
MLPTLVIGLREGLEASLIVGIIAAFLGQQGRRDKLRLVWIGVVAAIVLCLGIGVGLEALSANLPQRQQEGMETVIGLLAVVLVTYMIVWMAKHARGMKRELEGEAAGALAKGSVGALVAMAFLAVLREGFETTVFLLATLQAASTATLGAVGAILGILIAVAIGYGIYRGGVRLNLGRFFTATGAVLVFVAAGLVMHALRTAHEAGWVNFGQQQALDLTAIVRPGTPVEALLTGVLGIQAVPVVTEAVGWLIYAVPMLAYVLWPRRKPARRAAPATEVHRPTPAPAPTES